MFAFQKISNRKNSFYFLLPIFLGISFATKVKIIKIVCIGIVALVIIFGMYRWLSLAKEIKNDKDASPRVRKFMLWLLAFAIAIIISCSYFMILAWRENL